MVEVRRILRRGVRTALWLAVPWAAAIVVGVNPSTPIDYAMNLGPAPAFAHLRAPAEGPPHLVVLQHGFWRSAASLWKLERALRAHGYEVLNTSYPSSSCSLEEHAALLRARLEEHLRAVGAPRKISYVGHSMGGLVIRAYLARPDARQPVSVVFLGTPQRGAHLCEVRRRSWLVRFLMRDRAGQQLLPGNPFVQRLPVPHARFATIAGGLGDGAGFHPEIPGDDDGTVAVAEAQLPGAAVTRVLPIGHTRLSFHDTAIEAVLAAL